MLKYVGNCWCGSGCLSTPHQHGETSQQIQIISPVMVWPLLDQEDQHLQDCHLLWVTATIMILILVEVTRWSSYCSSSSWYRAAFPDNHLNQQMNRLPISKGEKWTDRNSEDHDDDDDDHATFDHKPFTIEPPTAEPLPALMPWPKSTRSF